MLSYIFSFLTLIFVILNVIYIKKENKNTAFLYKVLASISFLLIGIFALNYNTISITTIFILVALACGFLGDVVLGLKTLYPQFDSLLFNLGIGSFGIGHIMYMFGLYFEHSNNLFLIISLLVGALIAGLYLFIMVKNKFAIKGYKIPIYFYCFVISSTCLYGFMISYTNLYVLLTTFGVLNILISDIILSVVYFTNKKDDLKLQQLNHLIYYLGQTLIGLSLLFI